MKLQTKLLSVLCPLALASGGLILALARQAVDTVLIEGATDRGFSEAGDAALSMSGAMRAGDESALLPRLHNVVERLHGSYAMALGPSGAVLAHTNVVEKGKTYGDPATLRALRTEKPDAQRIELKGQPILDLAVPVWVGADDFLLSNEKGGKIRLGTLRVGVPLGSALAVKRRILRRITAILLSAGGLMMILLLLFLRDMLEPVRLLAASADEIGRGRYGGTVLQASNDELGGLARSFNRMSRDLAATTVSRDYLDGVMKGIADILIVADSKGLIRTVNNVAVGTLGYAEAELLQRPAFSLFDLKNEEEEIPRFLKGIDLEALSRAGFVKDVELELVTKERVKVPVLLSGAVLKDREGKLDGVVLIAKDITQRRKAEGDLKLFRNLINQSNDQIYMIDPLTARFLDVNEKACTNSGYSREELLRLRVMDIDPTVPDAAAWKVLVEEVKKRGSMTLEGGHKRKDGSVFPIEVNVKYTAVEQVGYLIAMARDVTERKRMETLLIQSEKLSAVGQLAAGVAHEINNPLGIILGFAQAARKKVKDSDALSLPIKSIEREAQRCKNLVQNLLAFSRQNKARLEPFDLNEIVAATLSIIEAQARVKSVEVFKELGMLPTLVGDKNKIQQVIVNLCSNAIDAMPQGGKIFVRTKDFPAGGRRQVVLEVQDTGAGIPKEIQASIFNPFFTTKEVGKGTGLGLSLVYEIVQKHRGTIRVESDVGRGTLFSVSLPILSGDEAGEAKN